MFFHFDFTNYFRMIRLAWSERNPAARRTYLLVLLVSVPIVSTFHAICFFLDGILFPGLWRTEIRTPVFVVGHARSGTTLVHRLMSKLCDLHLANLEKWLGAVGPHIDVILFGDDLGGQNGPLISPAMYRRATIGASQ